MSRVSRLVRGSLLPLGAFAAVFAFHYLWVGLFPEQDPAQARWAALPSEGSSASLPKYLETQSYWLGYSYGLSLAFAVLALRRSVSNRGWSAGRFAAGGVTFTAFLAVAGCYLIGCCGSPMLVVWVNLFGAKFLPLAKPLMAGIATISIAVAWWWMAHSTVKTAEVTFGPPGFAPIRRANRGKGTP